jgi:hypothetical protein
METAHFLVRVNSVNTVEMYLEDYYGRDVDDFVLDVQPDKDGVVVTTVAMDSYEIDDFYAVLESEYGYLAVTQLTWGNY